MEELSASNLTTLEVFLARYASPEFLFRGQNHHFTRSDGLVSLMTSFGRLGCIPPRMLKWSHYAQFALSTFLRIKAEELSLEFSQAVLQHYGWRSFYLDASSSTAVSSWFASHCYVAGRTIDISEDWEETAAFLVHEKAGFERATGDGHLYILSRSAIEAAALTAFDLTAMEIIGHRPRYRAQAAWLIGPLRDTIESSCVVAHISAPCSVFAELAANAGFVHTTDLFPPAEEDPLLAFLLSMPWIELKGATDRRKHKFQMSFYMRSLEIPEYHYQFQKRLSPNIALFNKYRISENLKTTGTPFNKAVAYVLPDSYFFGRSDYDTRPLPLITNILRSNSALILEIDDLIRVPENYNSHCYGKGLLVHLKGDLAWVAELTIDHPGKRVTGFGANAGWYYSIDADWNWSRTPHAEDCPCDNVGRHQHHMAMLYRFEERLIEGNIKRGKKGSLSSQIKNEHYDDPLANARIKRGRCHQSSDPSL
jgi:hypothetical protein